MNRFENMTNHQEITKAIIDAQNLFNAGSRMIHDVFHKNDFKYESGRGSEIATNLLIWRKPIKVFTYSPKWIFTRSLGYFQDGAIHLNKRKLPKLTHVELVGLCLHEYSHAAGYSHGDNWKTEEKCQTSVPYFLSSNVEKWL